MSDLFQKAQEVESKEHFVEFLGLLIDDLNQNSAEWENKTLENYLEAMQAWVEDMEGYYINNKIPIPQSINWKVFTDIMMAAKIYE